MTFTVDRVPDGVAWPHATGFVTRELMEAALPAPADGTQFLVCGPPGMVNAAVLPALQAMGVDSDHYVIF